MRVNFQFGASRNYIRGADMYRQVTQLIIPNNKIDYSLSLGFPNETLLQQNLVFSKREIPTGANITAKFSYKSNLGSENIQAFLFDSNDPVNDRYEYDEKYILQSSKVLKNKVSISRPLNVYTIDVVVALNKKLLETITPFGGRWIFTRLEINKLLPVNLDESDLELEALNYSSVRLTKTLIKISGTKYGYIYFTNV